MTTTALPRSRDRRTPRKPRPPALLCDYCVWPAGWIAPESGALVCDPYSHRITAPENCHQLVRSSRVPWELS